MKSRCECPPSATHPWVATSGFAAMVIWLLIVHQLMVLSWTSIQGALLALFGTAAVIFSMDFFWQKVHLRKSTGLTFDRPSPSWSRVGIKLLGLFFTLLIVSLAYWIFPEYQGDFYSPYWQFLKLLTPFWLVAVGPYFYFVDARMNDPHDSYWRLGKWLLDSRKISELQIFQQHFLGWLVKAYFLPLMLVYFTRDIQNFRPEQIWNPASFQQFFDRVYETLFLFDVGLVSMGYLFSLKLFDTHLRSAEPTFFGWAVALVCYEPAWSLIGVQYLAYSKGPGWGTWLAASPFLYQVWGIGILLLLGVYLWASVMFGCRFSNLTHRGILTSGPYRWVKHPAYLSKNLAWWMISVPFIVQTTWQESLRRCLLLAGLNFIYYLRAKTEERHLSSDPLYRQYATWIANKTDS